MGGAHSTSRAAGSSCNSIRRASVYGKDDRRVDGGDTRKSPPVGGVVLGRDRMTRPRPF